MAKLKNAVRADGLYKSKVYLGDGKYKYVYAQNNKELEKKVTELKIKLGKGIDLTADRDTFKYWADRWIKTKSFEVSANRMIAYNSRRNNLSQLDNYPINKIRSADIQDIVFELATEPNSRTGKPYSKYTLSEIKNIAHQIFDLAINNRVLDYNPVSAIKIPQNSSETTKQALTDEQQKWILDTPHRAQTAAMIMLYAGLRRGELIPLTWQDVDLTAKTISVNKTVEFIKGKPNVKATGKTKSSIRTVYIPQKLVDYLAPLQKPKFALVCPSAQGKLMSDSAWKRLWDSYLTELNFRYGDYKSTLITTRHGEQVNKTKGEISSKFNPNGIPFVIPNITAHCLRHTYITMLYKAGVDVLTAKEQSGHSDIKTTLSIYTHLDSEFKKKSIEKLDIFLDGGNMGVKEKA